MSLSRKNWSALSSLAKQRTLEDEEEIFREQRRRNRNQSSCTDANEDLSPSTQKEVEPADIVDQSANGRRSWSRRLEVEPPIVDRVQQIEDPEPQESLGPEDDEKKFLEILKSREKRRHRRQIEILQNLKTEQQNGSQEETEEGEPRTADLPPQVKHAAVCNKERAEAPPAQRSTSKEASVAPSSQKTSVEEQRSSEKSRLKMAKVGPAKLGGHTGKMSVSVPTSLAEPASPVRSSSPPRSSHLSQSNSPSKAYSSYSVNGPSSPRRSGNDGDSDHDGSKSDTGSNGHHSSSSLDEPNSTNGLTTHDGSKMHNDSSNHDRATSHEEPKTFSRSTSLRGPPSLSSSTSPSVQARPGRQAETKSYSVPTHAKKTDRGSASEPSPPKLTSPTGSMAPVSPSSPAGLTSPTTISISPSQKHTSKVFLSAIKISRNTSLEDTEVKKVTKVFKGPSVERITEGTMEVDGVKSPTDRTALEEEEEVKTVPRNPARHTLRLQLSTSGEEKKETVRSEVRLPAPSPGGPASPGVPPPEAPTSSTGLRRMSPRTTSFRVITQMEQSGSPLSRSASLRIPGRSFKLDAKLEKYASALEKSESIKSPTRTTAGFFPSPEGVASKRSLFEKEAGGSGANTPTSRKTDTSLTGAVSSRINQWISKTQGEASKNSGAKDAKKVDIASKRSLWEQRSSSTDPKP